MEMLLGFSFENHGGSKYLWSFGKAVRCAAF